MLRGSKSRDSVLEMRFVGPLIVISLYEIPRIVNHYSAPDLDQSTPLAPPLLGCWFRASHRHLTPPTLS